MPIVPASAPPPRTGLRLIDDLFGAAPDPNAPRPTQNTISAATPYETYAQPAVLGLRRAMQGAGHLLGFDDPVQSAMMSVNPLAMAEAPAARGAAMGAHALEAPAEAAMGGLRRAASGGLHSLQGAMESLLGGAENAGASAIEHIAPGAETAANNASGESAASLEAMGRRAWESNTGRKLMRRLRSGQMEPFIGEPGDTRVNPGESIGYLHPGGNFEVISGGR